MSPIIVENVRKVWCTKGYGNIITCKTSNVVIERAIKQFSVTQQSFGSIFGHSVETSIIFGHSEELSINFE